MQGPEPAAPGVALFILIMISLGKQCDPIVHMGKLRLRVVKLA